MIIIVDFFQTDRWFIFNKCSVITYFVRFILEMLNVWKESVFVDERVWIDLRNFWKVSSMG